MLILFTCNRHHKRDGCTFKIRTGMAERYLIHTRSLVIEGSVLLDGITCDRVRKYVENRCDSNFLRM